jgi:hypothetical protein
MRSWQGDKRTFELRDKLSEGQELTEEEILYLFQRISKLEDELEDAYWDSYGEDL